MLKYVLGLIAVAILALAYFMLYGLGSIKAMTINGVDLTSKSDGTYHGSFSKNRWNYNVSVTVKDHKITEIKMLDDKMKMADELNTKQIDHVIETQSTTDVATAATVNSKALLKAIENALNSQPK